MSSLSAKDRVSLCSFTFSDGRRCRTPRVGKHPRFCFYHAQQEDRARAAQKLGKDLAYFFSGDYLSACDLSTALARLIPAVLRGDVKPKTARTIAYLLQTLLQAIHISQDEYINAFDTDVWRKAVRNSVNGNHDYLFPPDPEPAQSESLQPQPQPAQPQTQAQQPASVAPSNLPQLAPVAHPGIHPDPVGRSEALRSASPPEATPSLPSAPTTATSATSPAQPQTRAQQPASQHVETPVNCHSERSADFALPENLRSEESAFPESQADLPPPSPVCHPERSEGSHPIPTTPFTRSAAPAAQPDKPQRVSPSAPQSAPNRGAYALHFDHSCRLLIDGKPF